MLNPAVVTGVPVILINAIVPPAACVNTTAPALLTVALTYGISAPLTPAMKSSTVVPANVTVAVVLIAVPGWLAVIENELPDTNGPGVVSFPVISVAPVAYLSNIVKLDVLFFNMFA